MTLSQPKTVLITGASGFIGSHVVEQALKSGFTVRATARGLKADRLKSYYAKTKDPIEIIEIEDIADEDLGEAMSGVFAVIHVASPPRGSAMPEAMFETAVEGTLNIARQAERAGVRKIVATGSITNAFNGQGNATNETWNSVTPEEAIVSENNMIVYMASKVASEKALWEWADEHPHMEVTTLLPSLVYGPFAQSWHYARPTLHTLSTNLMLYNILHLQGSYQSFQTIDVRDVALLHVAALQSPVARSEVPERRKRFLISSPYRDDFDAICEVIKTKRPTLKSRMMRSGPTDLGYHKPTVDYEAIRETFGFSQDDWTPLENTIVDAVDSILFVEEQWKGVPPIVPYAMSSIV
ncbi:hypothetical protein DL96DRAFT_1708228 [Flagelloscypha sp. PMI_526]|nr:hypothetical protein DL96DRAFT_1708228 [Flagelloscypha sp. PMI_526]